MPSEHDNVKSRKYLALYIGVVVDNADPRKLGRVKMRVPGVLPQSGGAWARPLGWPAAGGERRGWFAPPPVGAEVGVLFEQGDVDRPCYFCGYPGRNETPEELDESSAEDATQVQVFESDRWRLTFDNRAGHEQLQLKDKLTSDVLEIDGVAKGIQIKGTGIVYLKSYGGITLDAPSITLGGRVLVPNGKPIN